jgi:hypothetical protein
MDKEKDDMDEVVDNNDNKKQKVQIAGMKPACLDISNFDEFKPHPMGGPPPSYNNRCKPLKLAKKPPIVEVTINHRQYNKRGLLPLACEPTLCFTIPIGINCKRAPPSCIA